MNSRQSESRRPPPLLEGPDGEAWAAAAPDDGLVQKRSAQRETVAAVSFKVTVEVEAMYWDSRRPRNCE